MSHSSISDIGQIHNPKRNAPIWNEHTRVPYDDELQSYWSEKDKREISLRYCKHCKSSEPQFPIKVLKNFRDHLRTKHKIQADSTPRKVDEEVITKNIFLNQVFGTFDLKKIQRLFETHDTADEFVAQILKSYALQNQEKIRRALVELFVREKLSFRKIENGPLMTFASCLNPYANMVLPGSHSSVQTYIVKEYESQRDLVRQLLQSSYTRIHISADIWTTPNTYLALGLVGGFVRIGDETPEQFRILLGLKRTKGHSGEDQFHQMMPVLEELGIERNIGCIMGDNSETNDTLCRALANWFDELEVTPEWNPQTMRGRCLGHIINLIVKAWLVNKEILEDVEEDEELI